MPISPASQAPVTAFDLRQRGAGYVRSAQACFSAGQVDDAWHMSGLAAELALKAAYCVKMGWADWPADRAELRARGGANAFSHDLDELLRMSDSVSIPMYASIDWRTVAAWDIEDRYARQGTADRDRTSQAIADTIALCRGLIDHTLLRHWMQLHSTLRKLHGPFALFAASRLDDSRFTLQVSACWTHGQAAEDLKKLVRDFRTPLDIDLRAEWACTDILRPEHPIVRTMLSVNQVEGENTVVTMQNCVVLGQHAMSLDGFVMECVPQVSVAAAPSPPPAPGASS